MIKRQLQPKTSSSSDSGFTIIESLLGIVVVAILMAAISPVLVMSTAIRVQSKRVEKATQVANTFIDGLRIGSIKAPGEYPGDDNKIELVPADAENPRTLEQNLITMPAPETATDSDLYLFTKDGNICHTSEASCTKDPNRPFDEFYIQARQMIVTGSGVNDGYRLAFRVYRGDVDFDKTLLANSTASVVTEGLGDKQAPAIERTVDIGNINTSFQALCQRLGLIPKTNVITEEDSETEELEAQNCQ
ncbi:hormogonium polysaccharide secretion pseudopilin HpsB [Nodularia sp. UHCC 0506]|uniref:hormogonium polysaccharide secretion pseudopilin HpsB n=1 Tax=Nodularia sp. UHCC 0506 TaxID=3110243 RepID=UPI002B21388F|nr:hormogonium polysaccharide secretion pseudopilin HpsB [Nodularia sp. UHCC 0506]MEA5516418.1 hormogonium polysaccharide secretion pseudopilin HpsB [Nodularia sp. UHCC 0506]